MTSATTKPMPAPMATPGPQATAQRAHQAWSQGRALAAKGQWVQAVAHYQEAIDLRSDDALYWLNLAMAQARLGQAVAALDSARHSLALDHRLVPACQMVMDLALQLNRAEDALEAISVLTHDGPLGALLCLLKGGAHVQRWDWADAAQCFLQAMQAPDADNALRRKALVQLGFSLARLERYADAAQAYRTALVMEPLALEAALFAAHYASWCCDWESLAQDLDQLQACLERVQALPDRSALVPISPFCLLSLTDNPHLMRWAAELACPPPAEASVTAHLEVAARSAPWRIGMMSSDFHHHATSMLMVEMLEKIDQGQFELYLYSSGVDDGSALRQRVKAAATQFVEVGSLSDAQLADRIRADQISVLIDLKGFTIGTRLQVMAQRVAPIQVAWLGFPGTCGASFVDYIIGDPVVTPLEDQPAYSEHIAQMPWTYQPGDSQRPTPPAWSRAQCGLPEGAMVYASFNQAYKISAEMFQAWCEVLGQVPGSVLWLLVPQVESQIRLRAWAAHWGIDEARLIFAPFVSIEEHRARLPQADVILDTYPCGGHTTASDALWAGVPMVARMGPTFAAKVAPSLLRAAQLPELVCQGADDYIALAVRLGQDSAERQRLRQHLQAAKAGHGTGSSSPAPLFDSSLFARDFGQLLLRMLARWQSGQPPAPLGVTD
jgi:predicted O-linked N-acetylglucosamine transferase (SPINDLY family)